MRERDSRIDILKFIGIICILLAHVNPPAQIFELRNFDVVLMVFLTGTTYYISSGNRLSYKSYVLKRFHRLIQPTWMFLVIFFPLFFIIFQFTQKTAVFTFEKIVRSFLLVDGIGYVWIMRIYFCTALLLPFFSWCNNKIKRNIIYFACIIPLYFIYIGFIQLTPLFENSPLSELYQFLLIDTLGWGIIAAIGIRSYKFSIKEQSLCCIFFGALYFLFRHITNAAPTQDFKYPPRIYYIAYGLFVTYLLLLILNNNLVKKIFNNTLFNYIARNSLWIYLWHIIPVYILKYFGNSFPFINSNWILKFIFILGCTLILTLFQNIITHKKRR